MTDKARELLERALEELIEQDLDLRSEFYTGGEWEGPKAIEEIRAYLAEPEVKPQPFNQAEFDEMVRKGTEAWKDYKPEQDEEPVGQVGKCHTVTWFKKPEPLTYLFTHPAPRQEFVRLSEEDIDRELIKNDYYSRSFTAGVRFAEKHHGIGGGDE